MEKNLTDFGLVPRPRIARSTPCRASTIIVIVLGIFCTVLVIVPLIINEAQQFVFHKRSNNNVTTVPKRETHAEQTSVNSSKHLQLSAKPFINEIKGLAPVSFQTTTPPPISTPRKKTYPKNIQELIASPDDGPDANETTQKQFIYNEPFEDQETHSVKLPPRNFMQNNIQRYHDAFFRFKPVDMSDINLMALANVRFAPLPWVNLLKQKNKGSYGYSSVSIYAKGRPPRYIENSENYANGYQNQNNYQQFGNVVDEDAKKLLKYLQYYRGLKKQRTEMLL